MPFLGNKPTNNFTSFEKQDITGDGSSSYTLAHAVNNEKDIDLFINFVHQEPTTAYQAAGTTLSLTESISSADDCYILFRSRAIQSATPPDGSVSSSKLATDIAISGDLTVDTSTLKVDSSNNRVGIGTASPSYNVHSVTTSGSDYAGFFHNSAGSGNGTALVVKGGANNTGAGTFIVQDYGGNTDLMVDGNGHVTMPNQPCFYVTTGTASAASSGATYIGSNGTGGTSSNSANTNVGSHFAVADGKFTAPVAGQYLFFASASQSTTTTGPGLGFWKNASLESMIAYGYGMSYMSFSHQTIMTLAANDYVQAVFAHYNSVSSALYTSSFGGHLIG